MNIINCITFNFKLLFAFVNLIKMMMSNDNGYESWQNDHA